MLFSCSCLYIMWYDSRTETSSSPCQAAMVVRHMLRKARRSATSQNSARSKEVEVGCKVIKSPTQQCLHCLAYPLCKRDPRHTSLDLSDRCSSISAQWKFNVNSEFASSFFPWNLMSLGKSAVPGRPVPLS